MLANLAKARNRRDLELKANAAFYQKAGNSLAELVITPPPQQATNLLTDPIFSESATQLME